jgi:hypothetical protein
MEENSKNDKKEDEEKLVLNSDYNKRIVNPVNDMGDYHESNARRPQSSTIQSLPTVVNPRLHQTCNKRKVLHLIPMKT